MFSSFFEEITPVLLREWLDKGEARLIDVREREEHARQSIGGDELFPLSQFDPAAISPDGRKIVFYCRSGRRSADAAYLWSRHHGVTSYNLKGGILEWGKQD